MVPAPASASVPDITTFSFNTKSLDQLALTASSPNLGQSGSMIGRMGALKLIDECMLVFLLCAHTRVEPPAYRLHVI